LRRKRLGAEGCCRGREAIQAQAKVRGRENVTGARWLVPELAQEQAAAVAEDVAMRDHVGALPLGRFSRSYSGRRNRRLGLLGSILKAKGDALEAVANAVLAVELVQLVGVRGKDLGTDAGAVGVMEAFFELLTSDHEFDELSLFESVAVLGNSVNADDGPGLLLGTFLDNAGDETAKNFHA